MHVHKGRMKPLHAGPCAMLDLHMVELQVDAGSCSGISRLTSRGSLQRRYGCKGDAMVAEPNSP